MCFRSHLHKNDQKKGKDWAISVSQDQHTKDADCQISSGPKHIMPGVQQYYCTLQTSPSSSIASLQITGKQVARNDVRITRPKLVRRKTAIDAKTILPPLEENLQHLHVELPEMSQETLLPRSKSWANSEYSEKGLPSLETTTKASTFNLRKTAFFEQATRASSSCKYKTMDETQSQLRKKGTFRKRNKTAILPYLSDASNEKTEGRESTSSHSSTTKTKNCQNPFVEDDHLISVEVGCRQSDTKDDPPYSSEIQNNFLYLKGNGCTACLYKNWGSHTLESIKTIQFYNVDIKEIAFHIAKINNRFPCLMNLEFQKTNISSFHQLNCLCQLDRLHSLVISLDGNPITKLRLWKQFVFYKMNSHTLKILNGQMITAEDIDDANRIFKGHANIEWTAQKSTDFANACMIQGTSGCNDVFGESEEESETKTKEPIKLKFNPESRLVAKDFMDKVEKNLAVSMKLHSLFTTIWSKTLHNLISETLDDFEDMEEHMKMCISKVLNEYHQTQPPGVSSNLNSGFPQYFHSAIFLYIIPVL